MTFGSNNRDYVIEATETLSSSSNRLTCATCTLKTTPNNMDVQITNIPTSYTNLSTVSMVALVNNNLLNLTDFGTKVSISLISTGNFDLKFDTVSKGLNVASKELTMNFENVLAGTYELHVNIDQIGFARITGRANTFTM